MQSQQLVIAQKQQLKLSPQMYQSLELMALPLMDLREKIQTEIEKNPALSLEPGRDVSFERLERRQGTGTVDPFENSSDPGYIRKARDIDPDAKQKFMEGALSRPESLQEHLFLQLSLLRLTEEEREMGELLISNLDHHGFYCTEPEEIVPADKRPLMNHMVSIVQEFDPSGICTANVIESLVLQARLSGMAPDGTEEVLRHHRENIKRGKLAEIAKSLNTSPDEVEEIIWFIKTLNPYPGSSFSQDSTQYIVPDLLIRKIDGKLVMQLNADQIPTLKIDPEFEAIAETSGSADRETERRVGASLLRHQMDFFLHGPKYLRPLTLSDIAEEISVHETTVSRISNAKYIQTDWGIFPIKYFFTNAVQGTGDDGKEVSKTGVKAIIREIITDYTGSKRLSDQKISDLLAERNISVARRTVAKYRKELNIESSFER